MEFVTALIAFNFLFYQLSNLVKTWDRSSCSDRCLAFSLPYSDDAFGTRLVRQHFHDIPHCYLIRQKNLLDSEERTLFSWVEDNSEKPGE